MTSLLTNASATWRSTVTLRVRSRIPAPVLPEGEELISESARRTKKLHGSSSGEHGWRHTVATRAPAVRGRLEPYRQLEVLVVDPVAVLEQEGVSGGADAGIVEDVEWSNVLRRRTQIRGQRLDERRERRPVDVECRQAVADEEAVAGGILIAEQR